MKGPNGKEMWGKFVFREIAAPERLVFVNSFSDPAGDITRAPSFDDWPLEVLNTVTFDEENGKTKITLKGAPINAPEGERARFRSMKASMNQGFGGSFDQLENYLAQEK
jgi:uncharacterized protein YndB with AHSA1/START domain